MVETHQRYHFRHNSTYIGNQKDAFASMVCFKEDVGGNRKKVIIRTAPHLPSSGNGKSMLFVLNGQHIDKFCRLQLLLI